MSLAYPMQMIQDWITQQWVILSGRKIEAKNYDWLMGPIGNLEVINKTYIDQLAEKENLIIDKESETQGLIPSMDQLSLTPAQYALLSDKVIDFYEKTSLYNLNFSVQWFTVFKGFGFLLKKLFSHRLNQLNIPLHNTRDSEAITSEIISLLDKDTKQVKYVFWLRTIEATGQTVYSGVYGICRLPSGIHCVKAVFPLPNGNATVIMTPKIGDNGELILDSSGQRFGDAGFYFLLKDYKNGYWSKYIRSFRDELIISDLKNELVAKQTLTLWNFKVLRFQYNIKQK